MLLTPELWPTASISLLLAAAVSLLLMPLLWRRRSEPRLGPGTHVLITGGSKGLGLDLAKQCAQRGCNVTIVARNKADLQEALQQVQAAAPAAEGRSNPRLQALSADTGDLAQLQRVIAEAEQEAGPVDILICNAGLSTPGLFVEQDVGVFEHQMRVNYLGTVHTIKAALPGMLQRRRGRIVIITSSLAVVGFAGYSSYAPTKWALRGMADCLRNELQGTGVEISVGYPPDMDTPGHATENETKPELCRVVNDALGSDLFTADKVAKGLLSGIEAGMYHLPSADVGQNLLVATMTSLSPKRFLLPVHMLLGPIVPLVSSVYTLLMDRAARKYTKARGMPPRPAA